MATIITHEALSAHTKPAASSHADGQPAAHGSPARNTLQRLSSFLRVLGGATLVSSLGLFLLQGWSGMADLERYFVLLAFSGLLTGAGFLAATRLGDQRGGRLLLGLGMLSVTVNFAVAGSLAFSMFAAGSVSVASMATWEAASWAAAFVALAGAVIILPPVSWIGLRVLARDASTPLFGLFMITNLALLIPVRDSHVVVPMVTLLGAWLLPRLIKLARSTLSLATLEGRFVQLLMISPLLIVVGRLLVFYAPGHWIYTWLALVSYGVTRLFTVALKTDGRVRQLLEVIAATSVVLFGVGVTNIAASAGIAGVFLLPLFATLTALMWLEYSLRTAAYGSALQMLAGYLVTAAYALNLLVFPSTGMAVVTAMSGFLIAWVAVSVRARGLLLGAMVNVAAGIFYTVWAAASLVSFGSSVSLALMGVMTVLVASLIERHGAIVSQRVTAWKKTISDWD